MIKNNSLRDYIYVVFDKENHKELIKKLRGLRVISVRGNHGTIVNVEFSDHYKVWDFEKNPFIYIKWDNEEIPDSVQPPDSLDKVVVDNETDS